MSGGERNIFNKMLDAKANEIDLINGVKMLSKIMYKHYQKPVMLFLDEYDVPLQTAYVKGFYDKAIEVTVDQETIMVDIENNEDNI